VKAWRRRVHPRNDDIELGKKRRAYSPTKGDNSDQRGLDSDDLRRMRKVRQPTKGFKPACATLRHAMLPATVNGRRRVSSMTEDRQRRAPKGGAVRG
jgi:hypothetical protein